LVPFRKAASVTEMLDAVHARYPGVRDFERDFPSLCFALATGVG
jgi:type III restriction enzyme